MERGLTSDSTPGVKPAPRVPGASWWQRRGYSGLFHACIDITAQSYHNVTVGWMHAASSTAIADQYSVVRSTCMWCAIAFVFVDYVNFAL